MDCPGADFAHECDNMACRKHGCFGGGGRTLMAREPATPLPRPEVNVTDIEGKTHVVISRDGKAKSYEAEGITTNDKIKDAVGKIINDRYTGEWLP